MDTTYKDAIEKSGVRNVIFQEVAFEFFQESFDPPVKDLTFGI